MLAMGKYVCLQDTVSHKPHWAGCVHAQVTQNKNFIDCVVVG